MMKLKVFLNSDFKSTRKHDYCLLYLLIKKIPRPFHAFPKQQFGMTMLFTSVLHYVFFQIQVVLFSNNISNCNSIIFSGIALAFRHLSRKKNMHCSILESSEEQKYELSLKDQGSQAHLYQVGKGRKENHSTILS